MIGLLVVVVVAVQAVAATSVSVAATSVNVATTMAMNLNQPSPREYAATASTGNGTLFVFGGLDGAYGSLNDLWVYVADTTMWQMLAENSPVTIWNGVGNFAGTEFAAFSTTVFTAKCPIVTACFARDSVVQRFDTNLRTWTAQPLPNMKADLFAVSVFLRYDLIMSFGGLAYTDPSNPNACHASAALWFVNLTTGDATEATQSPGPAYPAARFSSVATVHNGLVFMVGGCLQSNVCQPYSLCQDMSSEVWLFTPSPTLIGGTWRLLDSSWAPRSYSNLKYLGQGPDESIRFMDFGGLSPKGLPYRAQLLEVSANLTEVSYATLTQNAFAQQPSLRYGSSLETLYPGSLIIFGGSSGVLALNDMWVFPIINGVWLQAISGSTSTRLFGSAASIGADTVYMFGGLSTSFNFIPSAVLYKNAENLLVQVAVYDNGEAPPALMAAGLNYWAANNTMVMFGGYSLEGPTASLYVHSNNTMMYTRKFLSGTPIPPRWYFASVVVENKLIICGGTNLSIVQQSLSVSPFIFLLGTHIVDLQTTTASLLATGPANRLGAGMTTIDCFPAGTGQCALLFGGQGYNNDQTLVFFNETWLFHVPTSTWTLLPTLAGRPVPAGRVSFSFSPLSSSKVLLAGGTNYASLALIFQPPYLGDMWTGHFDASGHFVWTLLPVTNLPGFWSAQALVNPANSSVKFIGGLQATSFNSDTAVSSSHGDAYLQVFPGCPPGTSAANFFTDACEPCELGTYADASGMACQSCPAETTTKKVGATGLEECGWCASEAPCHSQGRCSVTFMRKTPVFACSCHNGYYGNTCRWSIALTVFVGVASVVVVLVLRLFILRWYRRRAAQLTQIKLHSELQERLLEDRGRQIEELEAAWEIQESELRHWTKIDEGAFGIVYRAMYRDVEVAVKRIRASLADMHGADEAMEEFQREITFMRTLRHAHLVLFFGYGRGSDGLPFLVTEFVQRGSLKRVLADKSVELTHNRRLNIMHNICDGMAYLHAKGRMHRDLKSANVLVCIGMDCKIADFGTARLASLSMAPAKAVYNDRFLTRNVGTLLWTAPEILREEPYDARVDVYSFGIVAWEVWTRDLPFRDLKSIWQIRDSVIGGLRPPAPPDAPADLVALMSACWLDDAKKRPTFSEALVMLTSLYTPIPCSTTVEDHLHFRAEGNVNA